jgi:hypothetical protein
MALLLFIGTAAWSAQTYLGYHDLTVSARTTDAVQPTVYRSSMVEQALDSFVERAVEHARLSEPILVAQPIGEEVFEPDENIELSTSTVSTAESDDSVAEAELDEGVVVSLEEESESGIEEVVSSTTDAVELESF